MSVARLELIEVLKHLSLKRLKIRKLPRTDANYKLLKPYENAISGLIQLVHDRTGIAIFDLQETANRAGLHMGLEPWEIETTKYRDLTWILPKLHELDQDEAVQSKLVAVLRKYPDIANELGIKQNGEVRTTAKDLESMTKITIDDLLIKFRKGHAKYGGGGFELYLLNSPQETNAFENPSLQYISTFFYRDSTAQLNPHSYRVFGNSHGENWELTLEAAELFSELAKLAGASLPVKVRERLSCRQNDPAGDWLAYMHQWSPPVEDQFQQRKHWSNPFRDAADAIERGGLHSAPVSSAAEQEIPPLDVDSQDWINNKDAAKSEGVDTDTLASYRGKKHAKLIADDKMFGIDRDGRKWRRKGTKTSHPYYYRPSLKSKII